MNHKSSNDVVAVSLTPAKIQSGPFIRKLASGIPTQDEIQPLVTVYKCEEFIETYHLYILVYLPDGSKEPKMDLNLNEKERYWPDQDWSKENPLLLRLVIIDYDNPGQPAENPTYTLWDIHCTYKIEQNSNERETIRENASGLRVLFKVDDPKTSRGTITIVQRT